MAKDNRVFVKDPDEVKDYEFDWASKRLATGDTVSSYTVTVDTGITKDSDSEVESGKIQVWLSGGTADNDYTVTNRVTTTQGRTEEATMVIQVRNSPDT